MALLVRYVISVSVFLYQKTVGILQSQFQTAQNVFSSSVFLPKVYHFVLIFASFTVQNVLNNNLQSLIFNSYVWVERLNAAAKRLLV